MTRSRFGFPGLALLLAAATAGVPAHTQDADDATASPATPPTFGVSSAVVRVDVVVRDEEGRIVRDLSAGDFEVYEDGRRQTLESFQVVALDGLPPSRPRAPRGDGTAETLAPTRLEPTRIDPGATDPAAEAPAPVLAERTPSVIAFVFDRMAPEARRIAHDAATAYVERGHEDGDVVGVFSIDLALRTLQPFTPSLALVEEAFDSALLQAHTSYASQRERARELGERVNRAMDALTGITGDPTGVDAAQAEDLGTQLSFDQAEIGMLRAFDQLEREQQGFASTNGLRAIVDGLKVIPGRKTIIFFSEGLALPASVLSQFRNVIAEANRAQVSIYSIDAAGLRVESGTQESRDELTIATQRRLRQESLGFVFGLEGPLTQALERNEDYLRLNPEVGLGQLARETGGFLVRDTNDASSGFRRIQEDMRFHYMLAYTPTNPDYDGRFREISVRVLRSDLKVQSRKGYFAVRPEAVVPLRSYETIALAQLDGDDWPDAFPVRAAALSFPEPRRPGRVSVLVELPGSAVGYAEPQVEGGEYQADFSVVVRVRDVQGNEVDRLSQHYLLSVPGRSLDTVRAGDVLFFKESNLPPGRYDLDVVAYDAVAKRSSARRSSVVVPHRAPLGLSSVALLERVEQLAPEERRNGNPLVFGEAMLYPHLETSVRRSLGPNLGFYFTAYAGGGASRRATIDLVREGETLVSLPTDLPEPDELGRIQYAGALPLTALPAGDFTLRVSVTDGAATATREAAFSVTE